MKKLLIITQKDCKACESMSRSLADIEAPKKLQSYYEIDTIRVDGGLPFPLNHLGIDVTPSYVVLGTDGQIEYVQRGTHNAITLTQKLMHVGWPNT